MSLATASDIRDTLATADTDPETLVEQYGTPFYLYSADVLRQRYRRVVDALTRAGPGERSHIHFAVKANDRLGILRRLADLGAGADLVSIGEHHRACRAGIAPAAQVFSGVGKTRDEIRIALKAGVGLINIESRAEVVQIAACAAELDTVARVGFRLNPDTRAGGHAHISTGAAEHKFGLAPKDAAVALAEATDSPHLDPVAVAIHIGSQITDLDLYATAFDRLNRFLSDTGFDPDIIDLGGGFAVDYHDGGEIFDINGYADVVQRAFGSRRAKLYFEIGRSLVAPAGVLIFRSLLEKQAADQRWLITDLAMNDFLRPALYQAHHRLSLLDAPPGATSPASIAGPVCESTDKLADSVALPPCPEGTLLALHDVGAYGSVMAMAYNARRLPPELLNDAGSIHLLRRAVTVEDFLAFEDPS